MRDRLVEEEWVAFAKVVQPIDELAFLGLDLGDASDDLCDVVARKALNVDLIRVLLAP